MDLAAKDGLSRAGPAECARPSLSLCKAYTALICLLSEPLHTAQPQGLAVFQALRAFRRARLQICIFLKHAFLVGFRPYGHVHRFS